MWIVPYRGGRGGQKYHIESEETETKRDRGVEDSEKEGKCVPQTQQHLYQEFNHWQEINLQVSDRPCAPLMWPVFPSLGSSRVQTYGSWFEWRLHLLVLQFLPVHVAEEAVLPDVSLPLRTTAQSFRWMLRHQLDGQREERELLHVSHSFSPVSLIFPVSRLCPKILSQLFIVSYHHGPFLLDHGANTYLYDLVFLAQYCDKTQGWEAMRAALWETTLL